MRLKVVKQSKLNKKINEFFKRPVCQLIIVKVISVAIVWIIALIPTWLFIFVWWLASPEGFWQAFALISAGLFVGGVFQIVFGIFAGVLTVSILLDQL